MANIKSSCDINNLSTKCKLEKNGVIEDNYHNLKQWCNVSRDKLVSRSLGNTNSEYLTNSVLNNTLKLASGNYYDTNSLSSISKNNKSLESTLAISITTALVCFIGMVIYRRRNKVDEKDKINIVSNNVIKFSICLVVDTTLDWFLGSIFWRYRILLVPFVVGILYLWSDYRCVSSLAISFGHILVPTISI